MIRGVNRCIVEVGGNGSKYFEKAILFIKPEYAGTFTGKLQSDAKAYLNNLDGDLPLSKSDIKTSARKAALRRRKRIKRLIIGTLCIAGLIGYTIFIKSL